MKEGWQLSTLDQLGRIVTGKTPATSEPENYGGNIPFVSPSDMQGQRIIEDVARYLSDTGAAKVRNSIIPARAVMVSCIGSDMGKAAIAARRCVTNQQINSVIASSDHDPLFIYYNLSARKDEIRGSASGSAQPILNKSAFGRMKIDLPPLPEQRAIAATLGALDDKIELNRKMNATLEAMARALFRDWFVDFGPTRARMEGRAPYLSPDLWSLFPDRLDAEGKPEGWEVGTLIDLALLNPESWTARNAPARVSYVDLANTKWGSIDKVEEYAWADAPSRARRVLRAGDTIVGTVRPGNGSFCYIGEDSLTGSTGFAALRPKNLRDKAFVWCAATSPENIDRLAHLADGGAYPAVRPEAVAATGIVIPPADVLNAFRSAVSANLDLMEANRAESRTLAQTRDLLLPRLMSGELRVAEAETLAREVA
ncbi:restriction endonuclease subunit S [Paracoccus yeei]|uniref:restriction endonuclease subunit S n=1 Tax=Paracoccus yeei TaxID=147645 RepID=UPI0013039BB4|nr:restriction endonuclease subunit S [Paracoccus yeei]